MDKEELRDHFAGLAMASTAHRQGPVAPGHARIYRPTGL